MRRTLLALPLLVLTLAAPAGAPAQDAPPPLRASLAACASGPTAEERFAIVTASMPALPGTKRMAMRFDLQVRAEGSTRWTYLRAKGFGRWQRSDPGRTGFVYTKRVERLGQAVAYRAVVRFRWYGSGGRQQRTRIRRSPTCRQPDQRPDLLVEALTIAPGADPSSSRYVVTVLNSGRTAAGAFDVGLTGIGRDLVRQVPGLPAGERATVELTGPRCPAGAAALVQLDVRGTVDESDERDNRFSRACTGR